MVAPRSRRDFLAGLPQVFKGTHVGREGISLLRGAEVRIVADRPFTVYADGDPIGELPVTVRAVPGAIQVLLPAGAEPAGRQGRRGARRRRAVARSGRGGTSLPGKLLLRLEPDAVGALARRPAQRQRR